MKYKFDKKNAFNLVEILLTLTLIGVMAVGFLPVLTKRAHKSNDPDCVGGFKRIEEEFRYMMGNSQTFTVPQNITSNVTFTLVGGGNGGDSGSYSQYNKTDSCTVENTNDGQCSFANEIQEGSGNFYTNFRLDIVQKGFSAQCGANTPIAGKSGRSSGDILISASKSKASFFTCTGINDNSNAPVCDIDIGTSFAMNLGASASGDVKANKLEGGSPRVLIMKNGRYAGMGEGCVLNGTSYIADATKPATDGACQVKYNIAGAGDGGDSGAYAKFSVSIPRGTECDIQIGKGGAPGSSGEVTSVTCGSNDPYTTASENNNLPNGGTYVSSQSGNSASTTTISGGAGGNVLSEQNSIFSKGGIGGCNGMSSSFECSIPRGEDGENGSGGGGGSCNDRRCSSGGRGGDGLVIVEYKVQCE